MKRLSLIAGLTLLYFNTAVAVVPEGGKAFLNGFDFEKDAVHLSFSDQATDGCLPDPGRLKDAYEGELRRTGFKITDEYNLDRLDYYFNILVLGFANKSGTICNVAISVTLKVLTKAQLEYLGEELVGIMPIIWENHSIIVWGKSSLPKELESDVRSVVNDLYLELARAKD